MKVLIVDDHKLFRQGLRSLMSTRDDIVEVVGEAATAAEAIKLTEQLHPNVVLMDIFMPDVNGLEATREIKKRFPDVAVVILTSSEKDSHLFEAVRADAAGYLLKNLDADELFNMLQGVAKGEAAMTRAMASRVLKGIARQKIGGQSELDTLTERESMVLHLVAQGESNPQIAEKLSISVNTVKTHLSNVLKKLQLDNRAQAAAYAVEHGITSSDD
ncbi:MAG: response regulator transcription factor [Anaerolineae bacterium]|nr:response regulator transcription factor [Anaerolineae bacterium]MCA9891623.1 response regulator transcription factor [Anaerolineae bacterium]MCB9461164.1 response regulator transcription factor [Anaerolineaceae bacterium]